MNEIFTTYIKEWTSNPSDMHTLRIVIIRIDTCARGLLQYSVCGMIVICEVNHIQHIVKCATEASKDRPKDSLLRRKHPATGGRFYSPAQWGSGGGEGWNESLRPAQ
jgi:hypothetical protein